MEEPKLSDDNSQAQDIFQEIQWFWQSDEHPWKDKDREKWTWTAYSYEECCCIQEAFSLKQKIADIGKYEIDLKKMIQINKLDKTKFRRVKREVKNEEGSRFTMQLPKPQRTINPAFGNVQHFLNYIMKRTPEAYTLFQRISKLPLDTKKSEYDDIIEEIIRCIRKGAECRQKVVPSRILSANNLKNFIKEAEQIVSKITSQFTLDMALGDFLKLILRVYTMNTFVCYWLNELLRSENWEEINILTPYLVCLTYAFQIQEYTIKYEKPKGFKETFLGLFIPKQLILFRGAALSNENIDYYHPRNTKFFSWNAVTSTSKNKDIAVKFVNASLKSPQNKNGLGVLFIIEVDFSSSKDCEGMIDVSQYSEYPSEQEIILAPGTVFEVLKSQFNKDVNYHEIKLKLVKKFKETQSLIGTLHEKIISDNKVVLNKLVKEEIIRALEMLGGNQLIVELKIENCLLDSHLIELIQSMRITTSIKAENVIFVQNEITIEGLSAWCHYCPLISPTTLFKDNNIVFKKEAAQEKKGDKKMTKLFFDKEILEILQSKGQIEGMCKEIRNHTDIKNISLAFEKLLLKAQLVDLLTSIESLTSLQHLSMNLQHSESVKDDILDSLKQVLQHLVSLKYFFLNISHCKQLSEKNLLEWMEALKLHKDMQTAIVADYKIQAINLSSDDLKRVAEVLKANSTVRILEIRNCQFDPNLMQMIETMRRRRNLQLILDFPQTESGLDKMLDRLEELLSELFSLEYLFLNIANCRDISEQRLDKLMKSINLFQQLKAVVNVNNILHSKGQIEGMYKEIRNHTDIIYISLTFEKLPFLKTQLVDLLTSIESLTSLQHLSMNLQHSESVKDDILDSLKQVLQHLVSLKYFFLNISHCKQLSEKNLLEWMEALKLHKDMQTAIVADYKIQAINLSSDDLKRVAEVLKANSTVRILEIRNCQFDPNLMQMIETMRRRRNLQLILDFSQTESGLDKMLDRLEELLSELFSLEYLFLNIANCRDISEQRLDKLVIPLKLFRDFKAVIIVNRKAKVISLRNDMLEKITQYFAENQFVAKLEIENCLIDSMVLRNLSIVSNLKEQNIAFINNKFLLEELNVLVHYFPSIDINRVVNGNDITFQKGQPNLNIEKKIKQLSREQEILEIFPDKGQSKENHKFIKSQNEITQLHLTLSGSSNPDFSKIISIIESLSSLQRLSLDFQSDKTLSDAILGHLVTKSFEYLKSLELLTLKIPCCESVASDKLNYPSLKLLDFGFAKDLQLKLMFEDKIRFRRLPQEEIMETLGLHEVKELNVKVQIDNCSLDPHFTDLVANIIATTNLKDDSIILIHNNIVLQDLSILCYIDINRLFQDNNISFQTGKIDLQFEKAKKKLSQLHLKKETLEALHNKGQLGPLCQGIKEQTNLTCLGFELKGSKISSNSLVELISCASCLASLEQLSLDFVQNVSVSDEILNQLSEVIESLAALKLLFINFTYCQTFSEQGIDHLMSRVRSKVLQAEAYLNNKGLFYSLPQNQLLSILSREQLWRVEDLIVENCFLDSHILEKIEKNIATRIIMKNNTVVLCNFWDLVFRFPVMDLKSVMTDNRITIHCKTTREDIILKKIPVRKGIMNLLQNEDIIEELRENIIVRKLSLRKEIIESLQNEDLIGELSVRVEDLLKIENLELSSRNLSICIDDQVNLMSSVGKMTYLKHLSLDFQHEHLSNDALLFLGGAIKPTLNSLFINFANCKNISKERALFLEAQVAKFKDLQSVVILNDKATLKQVPQEIIIKALDLLKGNQQIITLEIQKCLVDSHIILLIENMRTTTNIKPENVLIKSRITAEDLSTWYKKTKIISLEREKLEWLHKSNLLKEFCQEIIDQSEISYVHLAFEGSALFSIGLSVLALSISQLKFLQRLSLDFRNNIFISDRTLKSLTQVVKDLFSLNSLDLHIVNCGSLSEWDLDNFEACIKERIGLQILAFLNYKWLFYNLPPDELLLILDKPLQIYPVAIWNVQTYKIVIENCCLDSDLLEKVRVRGEAVNMSVVLKGNKVRINNFMALLSSSSSNSLLGDNIVTFESEISALKAEKEGNQIFRLCLEKETLQILQNQGLLKILCENIRALTQVKHFILKPKDLSFCNNSLVDILCSIPRFILSSLSLDFHQSESVSDKIVIHLAKMIAKSRYIGFLNLNFAHCIHISEQARTRLLDAIKASKFLDFEVFLVNKLVFRKVPQHEIANRLRLLTKLDIVEALELEDYFSDSKQNNNDLIYIISSMKSLRYLSLGFTRNTFEKYTDLGVDSLDQAFKAFTVLKHKTMKLENCSKISTQALSHLMDAFRSLPPVKQLSLGFETCTTISPHVLMSLKDNLCPHILLRHLSLSFTDCNYSLARALPNISDPDLIILKDILRTHISLQHLTLWFNCSKISDKGFIALKEALPLLTSLQTLVLEFQNNENISNKALKGLEDILKSLSSLEHVTIQFWRCKVSEIRLASLNDSLKSLPNLKKLCIQ